MSIPQRVAACLAAFSIVASFACGDDGTRVDVEPPATPGGAVSIRGTERLAWDQPASSYQVVRQYAFTLFIDENRASLAGVECLDSSTAAGYPCSARLPEMSNGTHTIQLAAVVDGVESARSSPLTVSMNQGRVAVTPDMSVSTTADSAGAREPATICLESGFPCVGLRREVSRTVPLSSPAALPDGRLVFVEGGRHLGMLVDGVVVSEPAQSVPAGSARIVALLIDPAFERTRAVRIAWVEESARNGRTLVITRLHESNNRFSDAAVVVPGVPLPSTGEPRVAQDSGGRIYVAVPSGVEGDARRGPDEGTVLRFSPDGLTFSAKLGPPTFAPGYDQPHAFTVDSSGAHLWISGNDRGRIEGLRSIPLVDPTETVTANPSRQESIVEVATARAIIGLAAVMRTDSPANTDFLTVDTEGALLWARAEADGLAFTRLPLDGEHALSLSGQPDGTVLLTTRSTGDTPSFSVFRLYPLTGR